MNLKKAIALLLTLSFLIISFSIIGSIFLLYKKLTNNSFEYSIAEDSFIIQSIQKKFKTVNINSSEAINQLLLSNFYFKHNNFKVVILFKSAQDKININNLLYDDKVNQTMLDFIDLIFDKYRIEDREFFIDLILDTIDKDKEERNDKSEISLYEPFVNGYIYNYKQFQKIIDYYYKVTQDKNIYKIPFKDIFSFDNSYTDCNHLSFVIKNILGIQGCNDLKSLYDKKFIENLGIIPFNKERPYYIWMNVHYKRYNNQFNFKILYDITNKRIVKIEKHIIY